MFLRPTLIHPFFNTGSSQQMTTKQKKNICGEHKYDSTPSQNAESRYIYYYGKTVDTYPGELRKQNILYVAKYTNVQKNAYFKFSGFWGARRKSIG